MKTWDAIVVGAGPAGSSTAFRLASAGASVLLLDRAEFPRDKPCGGGVTPRALAHLPVDIAAGGRAVDEGRAGLGFRRSRCVAAAGRSLHDPAAAASTLLVAERAAGAGAEFRDGVRVTAVDAGRDGAPPAASACTWACSSVPTASTVSRRRRLGLGGNREIGVALEGNLPEREG